MAMDPALAGLLGALVGGGATFLGTVVSNTQQARHTRDQQRLERKTEAYGNTLRYLLRVAHRRSEVHAEVGTILGEDIIASWFEDIVEAEYWLTSLTAVCGTRHREAISKAARDLFADVDHFIAIPGP